MTGYIPKTTLPSLNKSLPISQSIAVAYPFYEGFNTSIVHDVAGENLNGTPSAAYDFVGSPYGHAVEVDGTSKTINCGPDEHFSFGDGSTDRQVSIAITFKLTSLTGSSMLLSKDNSPREWLFFINSAGAILASVFDPATGGRIGRSTASGAITVGKWCTVVWTYDASGVNSGHSLWVNGVKLDTSDYAAGTYNQSDNTAQDMTLFTRGNTTFLMSGEVVNCVIWQNRELSQSEVSLVCHDPFCMYRKINIEEWVGGLLSGGTFNPYYYQKLLAGN